MNNLDNIEENLLEPFLNLKGLLSQKVEEHSKDDFLTFVKLMAPSIVSDFKMGNHIRVISNKLQDLEEGKIKRLMVFLPPRTLKFTSGFQADLALVIPSSASINKSSPVFNSGLPVKALRTASSSVSLFASVDKRKGTIAATANKYFNPVCWQ